MLTKKPVKITKTLIKRYLVKLEGKEGCNFHYKKKGDPSSIYGCNEISKKGVTSYDQV